MRIDNLNADERRDQVLRQKANDVMAPLGSTAVSSPGNSTRFIGNESLKVLGSQLVSGWLIVTGTLKVVGAFLLEGATTMTGNLVSSGTALFTGAFTSRGTTRFEGDTSQVGPFHVLGKTDVTGDMDITGLLKLIGDALLTGDFVVGAGGEITVAGAIPMVFGDGKVIFDSGGTLMGSTGGAALRSGSATGSAEVSVAPGRATMTSGNAGFNSVIVDSTGTKFAGKVFAPNLRLVSGVSGNVNVDPDTGEFVAI